MTASRTPRGQRERPMRPEERAKMVRRCLGAYLDVDCHLDTWEHVYPLSIRAEVLASISPEQRHRMRELRALQRGKRWA